jgi:uncharacterized membrane protein HdeD (DUF308 family)
VVDQPAPEGVGWRWWVVIGLLVLLVGYVLLFGPVVMVVAVFWDHMHDTLRQALSWFFQPHIWMAEQADWYEAYCMWWWELGGQH